MLIICNWGSEEFLPGTSVTLLRDALTKGDVGVSLKNPTFLLEGGFQKFLSNYPNNVRPRSRRSFKNYQGVLSHRSARNSSCKQGKSPPRSTQTSGVLLICSNCRPSVTECPVCREKYSIYIQRRHRYAERELEELKKLKKDN